MRYICAALAMLISSAAMAAAQEEPRVLAPAPNARSILLPSLQLESRVSADDVIARLLQFDRNNDFKIEMDELPERMRTLVVRGDRTDDLMLNISEIRRLTSLRPEVGFGFRGPESATYVFGDPFGTFSSRTHIDNTIEDLKLEPEATAAAKRVASAFADELEAKALALDEARRAALAERLKSILTDEENENFRAALARRPLTKAPGLAEALESLRRADGVPVTVSAVSAQGVSRLSAAELERAFAPPQVLPPPRSELSADDVIARLMSFDRDRDGRVALNELSERMQGLVARGDRGGDGALDVFELQTLATSQPFVARALQNLSGGGGYGFADTEGSSSRMHIENSIDDLRLARETSAEAKRIALAFVNEFEGAALDNLRRTVAPLVTAGQLPAFERDLKTLSTLQPVTFVNGSEIKATVIGFATLSRMVLDRHQLSGEQLKTAETAVEAFKTDQQFDGARQSALVARLYGLLTEEQSDNLRAALARRPLVKGGGSRAGFQRVNVEGFTITPIVR